MGLKRSMGGGGGGGGGSTSTAESGVLPHRSELFVEEHDDLQLLVSVRRDLLASEDNDLFISFDEYSLLIRTDLGIR